MSRVTHPEHARLIEMRFKVGDDLVQCLHELACLPVLLRVARVEHLLTQVRRQLHTVSPCHSSILIPHLVQCAQLQQIHKVQILEALRPLTICGVGGETPAEHVQIALPRAVAEAAGRCICYSISQLN